MSISLNLEDVEKNLCVIWGDVLSVDPGEIGKNDNFHLLGGNSILLSRMILNVTKYFKREIPFADFLRDATIKNLAKILVVNKTCQKAMQDEPFLLDEEALFKSTEAMINCSANLCNPKNIFLTGVTGFLGAYLLNELLKKTSAKVYCLVRGENIQDATSKLVSNLNDYGFAFNSRIKVLLGDLREKLLGISEEIFAFLAEAIDSIYHCGAFVHHVYDYAKLSPENINSTEEIIKLACTRKNKTVHYISTMSVVDSYSVSAFRGYVYTKKASEEIMLKALKKGLPVSIFRIGNITGAQDTGAINPKNNHELLLLKGCIQLGVAPDWDIKCEMLPVDVVAKKIVAISLNLKSNDIVYNFYNSKAVTWREYIMLINQCGIDLSFVDVAKWKEKIGNLNENNALFPLLGFYLNYHDRKRNGEKYSRLKNDFSGWIPDKKYIFKCINYLIKVGFFPK